MSENSRTDYFYRITALWAVGEALLGGMLHGLKLPITGLVVAGIAAVCISWLGRLGSKSILKALLLVLLVKASLSPHSPFGAYLAVLLQGCAGALFFWLLPGYRLPTILTAVFALMQSALQKLLMLTLFFGKSFWVAASEWLQWAGDKIGITEGPWLVWGVGLWLAGYALAGLAWAWLALQAPAKGVTAISFTPADKLTTAGIAITGIPIYRIIIGIVGLLYLIFYSSEVTMLALLLRAIALGMVLWGLIGPLLRLGLHYLLRQQHQSRAVELQKILELMPQTKLLLIHCWQLSAKSGAMQRPARTAQLLLAYLQPPCRS